MRLHGYADRLELDDDGRVVVVDLKTGKYPPADATCPRHPQLGLYQLAVDHGAVDDLAGDRQPQSGGAELVQLRQDSAHRRSKVQAAGAAAARPGRAAPPVEAPADRRRRRDPRRDVRGRARAATATAATFARSARRRSSGTVLY